MATSSIALTLDNSSDASFRSWGSAISAALATIGLVQTADTGQINWTTVTRPTANNAAQGYEIWRFDDTLQATRPVYLKIEYGAGGASVAGAAPGLFLTVGSGTNGAGTITGYAYTQRRQVGNNGSNGYVVQTVTAYFGSNAGYLTVIIPHPTFTAGAMVFSVSRTCDSSGNDNADGMQSLIFGSNNNSNPFNDIWSVYTGASVAANSVLFAAPTGTQFGTGVVGSDTYFFPEVINLPKQEWSNAIMTMYSADVSNLTTIVVPNNGANHTYVVYTIPNPTPYTGFGLMLRYE